MRAAPALLLLLAACRSPAAPIAEALAKAPIDIAALEDAFRVEPGALRLHVPAIPAVALAAPEPWILENVSSRPVWVAKSSLTVEADHEPFLAPAEPFGRRLGGRKDLTIPRPRFDPDEWVLLRPGGRTPLAFAMPRWAAGDVALSAWVGDAGGYLVHRAVEFNENARRLFFGPALATHAAKTLLLPPLDWPGAPWHDEDEIDPTPLPEGRFELITEDTPERYLGALFLEGFIVDAAGAFVGRGEMKVLSVMDDDSPCRRAIYGLPFALPAGDYRLLVRVPNAAAYFLDGMRHRCDLPDGAASRWIPFRIE